MPGDSGRQAFTALVLAGERGATDPLAQQAGVCCKALIDIDGVPMVQRVLNALANAALIGHRVLSGPAREGLATHDDLKALIDSGEVDWLPAQPTPSTSAYQAMQTLAAETPVLVTTADHPLLSAEIVDYFCAQSLERELDVSVGLAPYERVRQAFPDMQKTVLRFKDGNYCGCNLFAFLTPEGRRLADDWRQVESERKQPLKIIRLLGWLAVLRYLLGSLSLDSALQSLSQRLGLRIGAVVLPWAEAAVDVDSVADRLIVQRLLSKRG